ncbi:hypothetical protein [Algicella marina]|uniref:Uncharacterized protein n=1 Tax=Algicella marina TaxID=2683284 RepID=A0A6P1SZV4_9RHOB|nr:hypothetical protein [Algicella marina]QHQ34991.1 hypothetical protein GO499_07165 [Algicella marina]
MNALNSIRSIVFAGLIAMASVIAAGPAMATDSQDGLVDIPPEEWFDMVRGRTVVYRIGLSVWAFETYPNTGNYVTIRLADGECMEGRWEHINDTFCFAWENREYSCFRHARNGDKILIIPTVDGEPSGTVQTVSAITDAPVPCGPELTS